MFGSLSRVAATTVIVLYASMTVPAQAQYYPGAGCSTCTSPAPMMARPVLFPRLRAAMNPCCAPSPCCQPCGAAVAVQPQVEYRQVAVTEYQEMKQTVKRPVREVKYVDQKVVEYKQITEQKTVEVPTVNYQNVTEYHTRTRDAGRWQTHRQQVAKMSPCQYDGRPNLFGMMSRTRYSMRSAFTPNYYTRRQYVPQYVSQQIPVTRQVAIRGTRKMTYNVAKVVPVESTRKVAVNTIKYVDEVITTRRPVTVMKTIPGTRTAFGGFIPLDANATTRTATGPSPDPISTKRTASGKKGFDTSHNTQKPQIDTPQPVKAVSRLPLLMTQTSTVPVVAPSESESRSLPSLVRTSGWRARSPQASQPKDSIERSRSKAMEVANSHR